MRPTLKQFIKTAAVGFIVILFIPVITPFLLLYLVGETWMRE